MRTSGDDRQGFDIDQVDVFLVPEEDKEVNPAGVKGLGELAKVGTNAAISKAVFCAGKRIRRLAIRIEDLLMVQAKPHT